MTATSQITKHLWEELTEDQRNEFREMARFVGDKDEAQYKYHTYQLKDGKPHGYIAYHRSLLIKQRLKP